MSDSPSYPFQDPKTGDWQIDPNAGDAAYTVVYQWSRFAAAKNQLAAASALVDLSNAMFDLSTWCPPLVEED